MQQLQRKVTKEVTKEVKDEVIANLIQAGADDALIRQAVQCSEDTLRIFKNRQLTAQDTVQ